MVSSHDYSAHDSPGTLFYSSVGLLVLLSLLEIAAWRLAHIFPVLARVFGHARQEAQHRKFIDAVEHVTFSGEYATEKDQQVLYVTERCVFELRDGQVVLTEVAPGIDIEREIIGQMNFVPQIAANLRDMDKRIFRPERMGLSPGQ